MRKEYLVIKDLVIDSTINGTARAIEFMKEGWEKGESLGTEHLRVYEMKLYEPGEKTVEQVNEVAEGAYVKLCKDWMEGRGSITHEVLVPLDTFDSLKAAADGGYKTPQQEFAEKGYVVIDQAVTKGALMAKFSKSEPPMPPPNLIEYVKKVLEAREAEALLKVKQEIEEKAEQNRLRAEGEAQADAEETEKREIAQEEEDELSR